MNSNCEFCLDSQSCLVSHTFLPLLLLPAYLLFLLSIIAQIELLFQLLDQSAVLLQDQHLLQDQRLLVRLFHLVFPRLTSSDGSVISMSMFSSLSSILNLIMVGRARCRRRLRDVSGALRSTTPPMAPACRSVLSPLPALLLRFSAPYYSFLEWQLL